MSDTAIRIMPDELEICRQDFQTCSAQIREDTKRIDDLLCRLNNAVKSPELEEMSRSIAYQIEQMQHLTDDLDHVSAYIDNIYAIYNEGQARFAAKLIADLKRSRQQSAASGG